MTLLIGFCIGASAVCFGLWLGIGIGERRRMEGTFR